MAGTYVPILVGALLGVVISLAYIKRTKALSDMDSPSREAPTASRQQAVRSVLGIYVLIAWACLAVSLALGDFGFILTSGVIAIVATVGAGVQWHRGTRGSETAK